MVNLSWGVQTRTFLSGSDRRPNDKGIGARMNKRMSNRGITSKFSLLCYFFDGDKDHDEISWISNFSWPQNTPGSVHSLQDIYSGCIARSTTRFTRYSFDS